MRQIGRSISTAVLLAVSLSSARAATAAPRPPKRTFDAETRVFTSSATPSFQLAIPTGFEYLGNLEFPLEDTNRVDLHLFVERSGATVSRMILLQFEGFVEGAGGSYHFVIPKGDAVAGSNYRFHPERVRLGLHDYVHNTWAYDQGENAARGPGREADRRRRFLDESGLELDSELIMARFVREVGPERRNELILFYVVPLADRGHRLAEFPDEPEISPSYDALSDAVSAEALAIFRSIEDDDPLP